MGRVTLSNLRARFGAAHEPFAELPEGAREKVVAEASQPPANGHQNPSQALSVVIVYNDLQAVLRAVETLKRLSRNKFRDRAPQRLMPVPVTQLRDPSRFDHLLSDANSADIIIVSFNGQGGLPALLKKWIEDCLAQQRTVDSSIVALLNSNERLDPPDSPRYQFLRNAAWAAGLDFFAPSPGMPAQAKTSSRQLTMARTGGWQASEMPEPMLVPPERGNPGVANHFTESKISRQNSLDGRLP